MKIGVVPPHHDLLDNDIFGVNEDYDLRENAGVDRVGFHKLYTRCRDDGHTIATIDRVSLSELDVCLFIDPHYDYLRKLKQRDHTPSLAYMMREPPSFVPENNIRNLLSFAEAFNVVFTWSDRVAACGDKFVRYRWPQRTSLRSDDETSFEEKDLLVNVSSRKFSTHPNELYSAREAVIEYYDEQHPEDFSLYGINWNEPFILSERYHFGKPAEQNYRTYEGEIADKLSAYFDYRFALCFENMTGVDGWITEKMFDCFRAGIVPVYWGADDVADEVPEDAFVDYRNYRTPAALHEELESIGPERHQEMAKSGRQFLNSEQADLYRPEQFADDIYEGLQEAEQYRQASLAEIRSYDFEFKADVERLGVTKRGQHEGIPTRSLSTLEQVQTLLKVVKCRPKLIFDQPEIVAETVRRIF